LRLWQSFGLAILVVLAFPHASFSSSTPPADSTQAKNILILYAFSDPHIFAPVDSFKSAVRERVPGPVNFFVEYMESQRLEDPGYEKSLSETFRHTYGGQHLDVVIVATIPALQFAMAHRQELFPGVPIVFNHIDARRVPKQGVWPGITGVTETVDVHGSVDLVFRLQPDTHNVAVIAGTTGYEKYWLGVLHRELSSRSENVKVLDLVGLPSNELMQRVSQFPPHTAVFFLLTPQLSAQPVLGTYELIEEIGRRVPTYCMFFPNYCIDREGIGGSFADLEEQNVKTAELVARIFSGEKPENIPVVHDSGARTVADSRQLTRWKLSESRLPPGSIVLFRPPSAWQQHKLLILVSAAVIVFQLLLILGLLRERSGKRRTVIRLTESEERFRVMADSAPTLIWMTDVNGGFTYLNQRTLDFTRAAPDALRNGGWQSFIHPDDLRGVLETNASALRRREGFSKEFRLRRHDGVYRWMFDVSAPRLRKDGSFAGFIGSIIDISDQKTATEALTKLGGRLMEAQETERNLIARELHDDICQRLAMLSCKIENAMEHPASSSEGHHDDMKEIWDQCSNLAGDVQKLSHELHSSILDHLGLAAAADNFCAEFSQQHDVRVEFTQQSVPNSLSRDASLSLFRILQETLRNAFKHSGVRLFHVCLAGTPCELTLQVRDQGIGFDVRKARVNGGLGLISMQERVSLLHGSVVIESSPHQGTKIEVSIPLGESGVETAKKASAG